MVLTAESGPLHSKTLTYFIAIPWDVESLSPFWILSNGFLIPKTEVCGTKWVGEKERKSYKEKIFLKKIYMATQIKFSAAGRKAGIVEWCVSPWRRWMYLPQGLWVYRSRFDGLKWVVSSGRGLRPMLWGSGWGLPCVTWAVSHPGRCCRWRKETIVFLGTWPQNPISDGFRALPLMWGPMQVPKNL